MLAAVVRVWVPEGDDDVMPRRLTDDEIGSLLTGDSLLRLATIDSRGYPCVTPLWFVWDGEAIYATSKRTAPHLTRLAADPRAGLLIDWEAPERLDGERPNRQYRAVADAELSPDDAGTITREITRKYLRGPAEDAMTRRRASHERMVIRLVPREVVAVASV